MAKLSKIVDITKIDYMSYKNWLNQVAELKNRVLQLNFKVTEGERKSALLRKEAQDIEKQVYSWRKEREEIKEEIIEAMPSGV